MILNSSEDSSSNDDGLEELSGNLGLNEMGQGFMHSVVEGDKTNEGRLITESINQGVGRLKPDKIYEDLVEDYSKAEELYGETFLSEISDYSGDYIEKNIDIPEFRRKLKDDINESISQLRRDDVLDKDYEVTDKGFELASLVSYIDEVDKLESEGFIGDRKNREKSSFGSKLDVRDFRNSDRFRDISIKKSIKKAGLRQHEELKKEDLRAYDYEKEGEVNIIYAVDSSGSMKGEKLGLAKKAGVALGFQAIDRDDSVGLMVFSKDVERSVSPTKDFGFLLRSLTKVKAGSETDIVKVLNQSVNLFPDSGDNVSNHLILLSDALPTVGENPSEETLEAAGMVRENNITISVVGIDLNSEGQELAKDISEVGEGDFHLVKDVDELDKIVLEDYYKISSKE